MKATLQIILALLVAGVIHIQAQEPPTIETAWAELVAAKQVSEKEVAAMPEAVPIKDSILASQTLTRKELRIAEMIVWERDGLAASRAAVEAIATSDKTGVGVTVARALVKYWNNDLDGWTEEMISLNVDLASRMAVLPAAPPYLKDALWGRVQNVPLGVRPWKASREFFKTYRIGLAVEQQIAATKRQKELLIAIPARSDSDNAWLAEICADLIALQLDQ